MSGEIILLAPAYTSMLTIRNLIYSPLKQITNMDLMLWKIAARSGKHGRSIVKHDEDETSNTVLNVSKVKDTGSNQTRWERTAVADA